jgi:hypothetical protein
MLESVLDLYFQWPSGDNTRERSLDSGVFSMMLDVLSLALDVREAV